MRECTCKTRDLAVNVDIDGDPGSTESTVSITCVMCYGPVFIERSAMLVASEVPMRLDREADGDGITYRLKPEVEG